MLFRELFGAVPFLVKYCFKHISEEQAFYPRLEPVIDYYRNHANSVDYAFKIKYGNLELINLNAIQEDVAIDLLISGIFYDNIYKYATIYETLFIKYNPIWNVDGTVVTEHSGNDMHILTNGKTVTKKYGEQNNQTVYGEQNSETTYGETNNTSTSYVSPYDANSSTVETNKEKNELGGRKDSTKNLSFTDTNKLNEHIDTEENSGDDLTNIEYNSKETITRQGNIGVTSTQSLIKESRDIAMFSMFDMIFNDIVNGICIGIWE